jgi:hypothetical protein
MFNPTQKFGQQYKWRLWSFKFQQKYNFVSIYWTFGIFQLYVQSIDDSELESSLFLTVTQRMSVLVYRHFRTTCRSYLQGSSCLKFENGNDRLSETSVYKYRPTLCNNSEDRRPILRRGMSLPENYFLMSVEILASPSNHKVETE